MPTLDAFLDELRASPLDWLRHYMLSIAGGAVDAPSGVATVVF
jgi:hypothetical protein